MLDNTPNQPSNFRPKKWVDTKDDLCRTYNTNSRIKYKTSMLRSYFYDYSDAHIFPKGFITIPNTEATATAINNGDKKVIFKNCNLFTNCISKINNTQVDNAKDIVWQYCRDKPAVNIIALLLLLTGLMLLICLILNNK